MKHSFLFSVWSSILSVCWMIPLLAEMASANLHQVLCCGILGIAEGAWSLQSLSCCLAGEVMIPPRISQWLHDSCWSRGSLSHSLGCGFSFSCCTQQACTIPSHPMHRGRLEEVGQTPHGMRWIFPHVISWGCQPDVKLRLCSPPTRPVTACV